MNENLASKNDLLEVRTEIKDLSHSMDKEFLSVRHEIKEVRHEMKEMESRLMMRLGSLMVTGIGVLAFLIKFN